MASLFDDPGRMPPDAQPCEFHPWSSSTTRRVSVNGVICYANVCDECHLHGAPVESRIDNADEAYDEDGFDPRDQEEYAAERRL